MALKPFGEVKAGERIEFIGGYYMAGMLVANIGEHNGKRMVWFMREGSDRRQIVSYASHRSVKML